jgi:hypothetical protein
VVFTPIQNWDQIAQQNIFPGESGGDYNALFGFANRPGGQFAHIQPSQMTVGQVMDFTNPKGAYGQTVKGQIGRVATPVGAYQVVGTTLRAAVNALGLDPNMPFDKNTQDMIGQWIYANQGPGAWEGWGKGGGGGGGGPSVAMSSKGGSALDYMMGGQDFPMFDPGMSKRDRLATGLMAAGEAFSSLGAGHAPTFEATDAWMKGETERRILGQAQKNQYGESVASKRQAEAAANATANWLATQGPKGEALAQAVASGGMSGEDAIKALTDPKAVLPGLDGTTGAPPLTDEALGNINTLRDDVRTDLAPFMETQNAAQNIFTAATGTGGTSDFTMAQQFAKLLDPTSVVREGELTAVMTSQGTLPALITRIDGELKMNGNKLSPEMKQEILTLTKQIVEVRRQSAEQKLGTYRTLAARAGLDPALIGLDALPTLPDIPVLAPPPPDKPSPLLSPSPAPVAPPPFAIDPVTGKIPFPPGGF